MREHSIDDSQRRYARVAGFAYLFNYLTVVPGMFGPAWIRGAGGFADGARRVLASEHLYRVMLASLAISWISIVVLACALYVTLAPVNKRLAQIALFMELGEAFVGAATVVLGFVALRLYALTQPPAAFADPQIESLIAIARSAGLSGFMIVMMFFSVGSLLFFGLFYRSEYIPRPLAMLGIVGSAISMLGGLGGLIVPEYGNVIPLAWGPIGLAEITTALWLVVVGIRPTKEFRAVAAAG